MKALHVEITNELQTHIAVVKRDEEYSKAPFHYHPELELVFIKEGYGNRIVGDKLDSFTAGEMAFLGSNLPHVWLNDEIFIKALLTYAAKALWYILIKMCLPKAFTN